LEQEAGATVEDQIVRAYELLFSRSPLPAEIDLCRTLIREHGSEAFCRALFNTNEFIMVY
jgi:hypothetical protein